MRNYEREPQHFLQSRTTPLNLPFPGGTSTSGLQQLRTFTPSNLYSHFRPTSVIPAKAGIRLSAFMEGPEPDNS